MGLGVATKAGVYFAGTTGWGWPAGRAENRWRRSARSAWVKLPARATTVLSPR